MWRAGNEIEQHASVPLRRVRAGELRWEKFLYELKAGPAGGRLRRPSSRRQPHHGNRAPASPSASVLRSIHAVGRRSSRDLKAALRTFEPLPGLALVLDPAGLMLVIELMLVGPTTPRTQNPRECVSDSVQHGGLPLLCVTGRNCPPCSVQEQGRECRPGSRPSETGALAARCGATLGPHPIQVSGTTPDTGESKTSQLTGQVRTGVLAGSKPQRSLTQKRSRGRTG